MTTCGQNGDHGRSSQQVDECYEGMAISMVRFRRKFWAPVILYGMPFNLMILLHAYFLSKASPLTSDKMSPPLLSVISLHRLTPNSPLPLHSRDWPVGVSHVTHNIRLHVPSLSVNVVMNISMWCTERKRGGSLQS